MEETHVQAEVSHAIGLNRVNLYYATGIVGNFSVVQMFDDGQHNDNEAEDGVFGATIPGYQAGTWVRFYIEALTNNNAKTAVYYPAGAEHDVLVYTVQANVVDNSDVVINELMASNSATAADNAGEFDDWIELYNKSANAINLSGYYLSDNPANLAKWEFPGRLGDPRQRLPGHLGRRRRRPGRQPLQFQTLCRRRNRDAARPQPEYPG
ncbi:MAG: lamin tail domain-containing protein [Saprospiraceae bacterium]|nr:lamin tail domain-containing protein [Saprospiraceae bacterium]